MYVTIEIDMDNEAFAESKETELARVLKTAANKVLIDGVHDRKLYDANGNRVGTFKVSP